ncbi:adenylate kinase [Mycolicibacterium litorale]|uniref:Adenylate kinase n=1 Tax=Mycolicibacterium litorale TaxID=758802 RepID=A0AAD1IPH1_9MYCO|nr:adenylate kinase [Mycolicibacterium litorale]
MTLERVVHGLTADHATTVLIDGRSGSGKSTLADRFATRWESSVVVRLDDIYPGWDGLAWAIDHVLHELLRPRADGRPGRWRRWDWATNTAAGWHTVEPAQRLILEGVGALSPASRATAGLGIWVDTPDDIRKQRALARDGELYRPHWERWAAQEDDHIARHTPHSVADIVVTETTDGLVWTAGNRRPV